MGIDYVIARGCAPRDALGSQGIIDLLKARSRAALALEHARESGDERDLSELTFKTVLRTPDGDTTREVRIQDLIDQAKQLDEHRAQCAQCPADRDGEGFGCTRYIHYPIPLAAERWLLERLPDDLDSTAGNFLTAALDDFDWSGEQAAAMRAQGDTYFESDEAPAVSWGEGEESLTVTADQIFHMLFQVGHIEPTHATILCLFFGLLPHDLDIDVLRDGERRAQALSAARVTPESDEDLGGLDEFLECLAVAAAHGYTVLIDA